MKNNSTTLSLCTANCCSWFYHLPVWYSYKFLCNFRRELVCKALKSMTHCSELGDRKWAATRWVTADSSYRTWLLPGAARGWAGWWQYAKFSPHGITERKRRTASYSLSVLLSYKPMCMWAFRSPLNFSFEVISFCFFSPILFSPLPFMTFQLYCNSKDPAGTSISFRTNLPCQSST